MVQPRVCLKGMRYDAPNWPSQLQWCDLQRGTEEGGQILAAFELVEVRNIVSSVAGTGMKTNNFHLRSPDVSPTFLVSKHL